MMVIFVIKVLVMSMSMVKGNSNTSIDTSTNCNTNINYNTNRDVYSECCYGHYIDDQLLDFVNADKSSGFGETNRNMMINTNPSTIDYKMPYIYDGFEWDHCQVDLVSILKK